MSTNVSSESSPGGARYLVLLGAIIVQLILGTVYGYSIFWLPLESELGLEPAQAKFAFAICILSFAVVMVVAGRVQDILGPRIPAIIGAVLLGGGFMVASLVELQIVFYLAHAAFVGAAAIILLMLFYAIFWSVDRRENPILKAVPYGILASVVTAGVVLGNQYVGQSGTIDKLMLLWGTVGFLAGAGIGFAYVCPIAALVKWFPERKGLVTGLAVAGFGFGAFFFKGDPYILNFKYLEVPIYGAGGFMRAYGVQSLFLVHGLVCLFGITIGALFLRNPPAIASPAAAPKTDDSTAWQDTLQNPAFYILWFMFFSGAMAGLMVIGILKPFAGAQLLTAAQSLSADGWATEALAEAQSEMKADYSGWLAGFGTELDAAMKWIKDKGAEAVGILAIFNALGRIIWGFVSDRIGRTPTFIAMFLIQAAMLVVLGSLDTTLSLAVGAAIVGFNFGGNFALFPSATADLFGAKNLGANYGWVFTSYGIAGVVGIIAGNAAMTHTGEYRYAFYIAAALCVISAGLAVGLRVMQSRAAKAVAA